MARRAFLIVLDGLGCGRAHDQTAYGDDGSDTLGNVARAVGGLDLPNVARLGFGRCGDIPGLAADLPLITAVGVAEPGSAGKDSTTGHWELCGVRLERPFPTYPHGFPADLIAAFAERTGRPVIGNCAASGTRILDDLGERHVAEGAWIVYTSADSVFQVAAHEGIVPLAELYAACETARALCVPPHDVSRVIARPFVGTPGAWTRTANRKDFSLAPPGRTLLDALAEAGLPRRGIGKVDDLFAGRAIASTHTSTNADAYRLLHEAFDTVTEGLVFANVIEFDQTWGHRNDIAGFHRGLQELDEVLPGLLAKAQPDDLVILTADHGNDPTTPSTDHSRERVPVVVTGPRVRPVELGVRSSFADLGQTVAEFLGARPLAAGASFLGEIWRD
jgi:phosphopentomutase